MDFHRSSVGDARKAKDFEQLDKCEKTATSNSKSAWSDCHYCANKTRTFFGLVFWSLNDDLCHRSIFCTIFFYPLLCTFYMDPLFSKNRACNIHICFLHKNMSCWTMSFVHHVQQHHKCIISRHRPCRSISTFVRTSRCSMAESQWALCLRTEFHTTWFQLPLQVQCAYKLGLQCFMTWHDMTSMGFRLFTLQQTLQQTLQVSLSYPLHCFFRHLFFQRVGNTEKRGIRAYLAASPPVYPHPIYLLLLFGNLVSICLIDCNTMDVFSARIAQGLLESTMPIGWKRHETLAACLRTFIFWWDLHSLRILKVVHCCCKVRSCLCMLCCWFSGEGLQSPLSHRHSIPSWEEQPFFLRLEWLLSTPKGTAGEQWVT